MTVETRNAKEECRPPYNRLPRGRELRVARCWDGMSQRDLATAAGLALRTVQSLDRGDTDGCRLSTARAIAEALGRTVDELFPAHTHQEED